MHRTVLLYCVVFILLFFPEVLTDFIYMYVRVVCVVIPFVLDVRLVDAGVRPHRIFPPSFCGACLHFYHHEKDSAISFPRRP